MKLGLSGNVEFMVQLREQTSVSPVRVRVGVLCVMWECCVLYILCVSVQGVSACMFVNAAPAHVLLYFTQYRCERMHVCECCTRARAFVLYAVYFDVNC